MKLPNIFSNRQFQWVVAAVVALALVFVLINIFILGGGAFLFSLNSGLNSLLALLVALSALNTWRRMGKEGRNRLLWAGLAIGWALWAFAEAIWTVYSVLKRDVPYPSLADLFWLLGYVSLGIGLFARMHTMPVRPNRVQSLIIWAVSATTVLLTGYFVLLPIVQDFDPQRLVESILNLVYPLADVFLAVIIWRLFFTYEEGDYGFGWRLLTLGFLATTAADLVFTYATWNEIYYPAMQANLISRFGVDLLYTFSYLLWFVGIYTLHILQKEKRLLRPAARVRMVRTYGHILVYTRQDDTVLGVSPNFASFFGTAEVEGKSLAEALGIPAQEGQDILEKLHAEGKVADLPLQVRDHSGALHAARLSGLAIYDPEKTYRGSNLLLQMRVADASFDDPLDQEARALARYLLARSGSSYRAEIAQFLSDYYLSYIKALLDMAAHQGGTAASRTLLDRLAETAKQRHWPIRFNPLTVLDGTDYPLEVLRPALPALLEEAKQFVSEITDPVVVEACLKEVDAQFSETVHRDAARYGKAEVEVWFSDHRRRDADRQSG